MSSEYGVLEDQEADVEVEVDLSNGDTPMEEFEVGQKESHTISPINRRQIMYLLVFQGLGSGVVNFALNVLIAYAMYRSVPANLIPFSSSLTCVVSDIIMTSFLIPCLTGIIGSFLTKNDLRVGKMITPIDSRYLDRPIVNLIPAGNSMIEVFKRSVLFGIAGVVVFPLPTLLFIYIATGTSGVPAVWGYVVFKGFWSAFVAMIVSPPLAFFIIASATPDEI